MQQYLPTENYSDEFLSKIKKQDATSVHDHSFELYYKFNDALMSAQQLTSNDTLGKFYLAKHCTIISNAIALYNDNNTEKNDVNHTLSIDASLKSNGLSNIDKVDVMSLNIEIVYENDSVESKNNNCDSDNDDEDTASAAEIKYSLSATPHVQTKQNAKLCDNEELIHMNIINHRSCEVLVSVNVNTNNGHYSSLKNMQPRCVVFVINGMSWMGDCWSDISQAVGEHIGNLKQGDIFGICLFNEYNIYYFGDSQIIESDVLSFSDITCPKLCSFERFCDETASFFSTTTRKDTIKIIQTEVTKWIRTGKPRNQDVSDVEEKWSNKFHFGSDNLSKSPLEWQRIVNHKQTIKSLMQTLHFIESKTRAIAHSRGHDENIFFKQIVLIQSGQTDYAQSKANKKRVSDFEQQLRFYFNIARNNSGNYSYNNNINNNNNNNNRKYLNSKYSYEHVSNVNSFKGFRVNSTSFAEYNGNNTQNDSTLSSKYNMTDLYDSCDNLSDIDVIHTLSLL